MQQGNVQWSIKLSLWSYLWYKETDLQQETLQNCSFYCLLKNTENTRQKLSHRGLWNQEWGQLGMMPFWLHCCHTPCVLYMALANQIDNTCACLPSLLVLIFCCISCKL
jgi:hypothetical protein